DAAATGASVYNRSRTRLAQEVAHHDAQVRSGDPPDGEGDLVPLGRLEPLQLPGARVVADPRPEGRRHRPGVRDARRPGEGDLFHWQRQPEAARLQVRLLQRPVVEEAALPLGRPEPAEALQ